MLGRKAISNGYAHGDIKKRWLCMHACLFAFRLLFVTLFICFFSFRFSPHAHHHNHNRDISLRFTLCAPHVFYLNPHEGRIVHRQNRHYRYQNICHCHHNHTHKHGNSLIHTNITAIHLHSTALPLLIFRLPHHSRANAKPPSPATLY